MRKLELLLVAIGMVAALPAFAQTQVKVDGYMRADGKYVEPYERSAPNKDRSDNNSVYPNFNPNTGKTGTRSANGPMTYRPRTYQPEVPVYSPPRRTQSSSSTDSGYRAPRQQPRTESYFTPAPERRPSSSTFGSSAPSPGHMPRPGTFGTTGSGRGSTGKTNCPYFGGC